MDPQKKRKLLIIGGGATGAMLLLCVSCGVFGLLIGDQNPSADVEAEVEAAQSPTLNDKITVTMAVDPVVDSGRVRFEGTTNLPDDTALLVSLESPDGELLGQSKTAVQNGTFATEQFSRKGGGHPPGSYVADLTVPVASVQPDSVVEVTGEDHSRLTGPLVEDGELGKTVSYSKTFEMEGEPAQAPPKAEPASEVVPKKKPGKWYEGGTLHQSKVSQWRKSSADNKLATSADFASQAIELGKASNPGSMEGLRGMAINVRTCIDEAVKDGHADDQTVGEIAAVCMLMMDM